LTGDGKHIATPLGSHHDGGRPPLLCLSDPAAHEGLGSWGNAHDPLGKEISWGTGKMAVARK